MRKSSLIAVSLLLSAFSLFSLAHESKKSAGEKEYEKRIAQYRELRQDIESRAPKLKDKASAEEIERHEQAMTAGIQAARAGARPGDLLAPVARQIRTAVRQNMRGPQGRDARTKADEENPEADGVQRVNVAVNAVYPEAQPVSGMPAELLQKLPPLPKELEYRFVGRDLVLLDAKARLILDYLKDVAP